MFSNWMSYFRQINLDYDEILALNSRAAVYGVDVISNGAANYLIGVVNFNDFNIYRAQNPSYLVNTTGEGYQRVSSFASNGTVL